MADLGVKLGRLTLALLLAIARTVRPARKQAAQLESQLAAAKQNVEILKADVETAKGAVAKAAADLDYAEHQVKNYERLAREHSTRLDDVTLWRDKVSEAQGAKAEDEGKLAAAELSYEANINGVNTNVANIEAELLQAQFYLDNTTMKAPEDGRIVNLQVRPGMVSGILRVGGIAALIASADRYLLATYFQENLKYVRPGQFARPPKPTTRRMGHAEATALVRRVVLAWIDAKK